MYSLSASMDASQFLLQLDPVSRGGFSGLLDMAKGGTIKPLREEGKGTNVIYY